MREIKFRVWTGSEMEYNVMAGRFGVFYVNPSNGGMDEKDSAALSPFNTKYPDSCPVMQYTGLNDKNGKEVYEGDVIKCTKCCPHKVEFVIGYGGTYIGGMPAFYLSGLGDGYAWTGDEEIIGNIHQNPELLQP